MVRSASITVQSRVNFLNLACSEAEERNLVQLEALAYRNTGTAGIEDLRRTSRRISASPCSILNSYSFTLTSYAHS